MPKESGITHLASLKKENVSHWFFTSRLYYQYARTQETLFPGAFPKKSTGE